MIKHKSQQSRIESIVCRVSLWLPRVTAGTTESDLLLRGFLIITDERALLTLTYLRSLMSGISSLYTSNPSTGKSLYTTPSVAVGLKFPIRTIAHQDSLCQVFFLLEKAMSLIPSTGDSRGIGLVVVCTVFLAIAIFAVSLRIWSRRIQKIPFRLNDYAIYVALVGYVYL